MDYIILEPLQIIDKIKDYKCLAKHGKINLCRKPVVHTILDIAPCQPGELEREVNGTANSNGAEEIVQDVALLPGKDKTKLSLLEAVDLQAYEKLLTLTINGRKSYL